VRLDPARDDDLFRGVDDATDIARERSGLRDGDDPLALHGDVPGAHAPGRHDLPSTNDEVKHGGLLDLKGTVGGVS
jgi:hypothetical protein